MPASNAVFTLSGLSPLEVEELKQSLAKAGGDPAAQLEVSKEAPLSGAKKGEPVTMFVILAVSQLALTGLAIYLSKGRTRIKKKERIRYTDEHGRKFEYDAEIEGDQQEAIKEGLMKQIGTLKIPVPGVGGK